MRIRELRKKAGLTMTQLADRTGVTHPSVVAWEQGRKLPSADKLPVIAAALGCKIDDLFADAS